MGAFVVYIIEWALCLSAFLLLYKMCFSGSTFHRFNRFFLLGSVVLSALLPLIHITTNEQTEPMAEMLRLNTEQLEPLPIISNLQTVTTDVQERLTTGQKCFVVLALTYIFYIAIQLVSWLKSVVKMMLMIRGKRKRKLGRWVRLVLHNDEYGPFSWMNYIVISDKEHGFCRRASIRHEISHIVLLHPIDLVFILLCTLVNPLCWLVMKEIKVVHEFEADDEVINHYHINSRDYQRLLVRRTVGAEAYALACSFNINIKKRIMMMKKKQSHWWRITWIAVTLPLVCLALTAFSKPKEALMEMVDNSVRIINKPIADFFNNDADEDDVLNATSSAAEMENEKSDDDADGTDLSEMSDPAAENTASKDIKPGDQITGRITDEKGEPVVMAAVVERDEYGRIYASCMSDKNGNFSLRLNDPKHKIHVMCTGYEEQTLEVKEPTLSVVLKRNAELSGVTVTSQAMNIDSNSAYYKDEESPTDDSGNLFEIIQKMPVFPGGNQELSKYISNNLRYPAVAHEMNVEAEIIVEFIVDKTGLVRSPKAVDVKASSPLMTADIRKAAQEGDEQALEVVRAYEDAVEAMKEEAVHVVRNMPRWEPSRRNGVRFDMYTRIPIAFKLL